MKRAARLAAILFLYGALSGCATMGVDADTRERLCRDARAAHAMALVALDACETHSSPEALAYWRAYIEGARIAIDLNCGPEMSADEIKEMLESQGYTVRHKDEVE